jgi:hypothetical protein
MGQYKQWLHYREIDQHLHNQLTQLTAELATLQNQAQLLEADLSLSENIVISSLLAQLVPPEPAQIPEVDQQSPVDQQELLPEPVLTSVPHAELDLLPEDIATPIDEMTPTAPLQSMPWWFRNIPPSSSEQEGPFIDQQSLRTDRHVERWLERWGRSEGASRQEEDRTE